MIFQILLVGLNILCLAYVFGQRSKSPLVSLIVTIACLFGMVASVFPNLTNDLAHWVGVGRGADLLFYSWIVVSFGLIINIQLKLITANQQLTDVVRHISLESAKHRSSSE